MSAFTIAIPSKGRLMEASSAFFADCGFPMIQDGGVRGYRASLAGLPGATVLLLSAREIAEGLLDGSFHVGVTGEDLLHDLSDAPGESAAVLKRLGFGQANVVVAVPKAWLDVVTMADLEAAGALFRERHGRRLRVATKYTRLTRRFFARKSVGEYRLVYSAGATEAAPASGAADLIVDITTTGATLEANGLKLLADGTILKSQAALCASLSSDWHDEARSGLKSLLAPIEARSLAGDMALLTARSEIPDSLVETHKLERHGDRAVMCAPKDAVRLAQLLGEAGCGSVSIVRPDFMFEAEPQLYKNFLSRL